MPTCPTALAALTLIKSDESKILGLAYGGKKITPGDYFPRAEATKIPEILFSPAIGTYLVVCLDIDAPFASVPFLSPILHGIQSGLKAGPDGTLVADEPAVVDYVGPGPPPGAAPHRYIFLLYEQPAEFDAKAIAAAKFPVKAGERVGVGKRMRFDLEGLQGEVGLGPVLAANYFTSN